MRLTDLKRRAPAPAGILQRLRREARPLLALAAAAACLLLFGRLAEAIAGGAAGDLDRRLLLLFRDPADPARLAGPPWLQEAARDLTALGSTTVLAIAVIATLGYLLILRRRAAALFVLAAVLGGQLLTSLLKRLFDRERPDLVPHGMEVFTASFPSGHAALSAVIYLTLGALLARTQPSRPVRAYILSLAVLLSVAVGLTRILLGVHWPSDVLAGWLLGAAWALCCWSAALWLQRRGSLAPPGSEG